MADLIRSALAKMEMFSSTMLRSPHVELAGLCEVLAHGGWSRKLAERPTTRILVPTNPEFHRILTAEVRGAVPKGIATELLTLPPDMQIEVDNVTDRASREMSAERVKEVVIEAVDEPLTEDDGANG
ncbi:MAG: hypothetical protein ACYDH6_19215 [Acidimicrobiales bacterium]